MKLNKKGFTLIELLAVVVILLAISVIAISSISAAIERNKAEQNDSKYKIIMSYAELYYDENKNSLSKRTKKCISLSELNLSDSEMENADGEQFTGGVYYGDGNFTYPSNNCS